MEPKFNIGDHVAITGPEDTYGEVRDTYRAGPHGWDYMVQTETGALEWFPERILARLTVKRFIDQ